MSAVLVVVSFSGIAIAKIFLYGSVSFPRSNILLKNIPIFKVEVENPVVERQEPRALIGCVGLCRAGLAPDEAEFGIELAPDYWGRHAYAVEIGRAMLDFGFSDLCLRVITGASVSGNSRIARLAKWFGAEIIATQSGLEQTSAPEGNTLHWRITREQWQHHTS